MFSEVCKKNLFLSHNLPTPSNKLICSLMRFTVTAFGACQVVEPKGSSVGASSSNPTDITNKFRSGPLFERRALAALDVITCYLFESKNHLQKLGARFFRQREAVVSAW